jgi:hypothetical protein
MRLYVAFKIKLNLFPYVADSFVPSFARERGEKGARRTALTRVLLSPAMSFNAQHYVSFLYRFSILVSPSPSWQVEIKKGNILIFRTSTTPCESGAGTTIRLHSMKCLRSDDEIDSE